MDGCKSGLFPGDFSEKPSSLREGEGKYGGFAGRKPGHTGWEVIDLEEKRHQQRTVEDLRLDPQARLCPIFDCTSIKLFAAPDPGEMGMRVLDNCAEENIR